MGLEHLKWWHWTLISLLMGWALAYVNSTPIEPLSRYDDVGMQFERVVLRPPTGDQQVPWVKNLVVYPATVTKNSSGQTLEVMPILYDELARKPDGAANEFQYRPTWFCSMVPYVTSAERPVLDGDDPRAQKFAQNPPGIWKTYQPAATDTLQTITTAVYGKDTGLGEQAIATCNPMFRRAAAIQRLIDTGRFKDGRSILIPFDPHSQPITARDWLNQAAAACPWIHYQYAWWRDPKYVNYVWLGSTFVIVGVIWPILLAVMANVGLGGAKMAEKQYDLSRYGTGKRPKPKLAATAETKTGLSEAGAAQLAAMNQSLMSELEQVAGQGQKPQEAARPAAAEPGKQFSTAPLEPAAPIPTKPEEEKDFSGEFYPVAHPKSRPEDEPGPK